VRLFHSFCAFGKKRGDRRYQKVNARKLKSFSVNSRASDGERVRNLLFTGCSDGLTRVWGIDDAACLKELNGISACVLCIKGKGNWIVAGGDDHTAVAFAIS